MEDGEFEQLYRTPTAERLPWYKSFWKVLALLVVLGVFAVSAIFGLLVYSEYQAIKTGNDSLFSGLGEANPAVDDGGSGRSSILKF